jgi:hypothetical protein
MIEIAATGLVGAGGAALDVLLVEEGAALLIEDGDFIVLEEGT